MGTSATVRLIEGVRLIWCPLNTGFTVCCFSCTCTAGKEDNWKPYQQDREGLELIQRLQDPATARPEYWGECPTATLSESVHMKEEKNKSVSRNNVPVYSQPSLRRPPSLTVSLSKSLVMTEKRQKGDQR